MWQKNASIDERQIQSTSMVIGLKASWGPDDGDAMLGHRLHEIGLSRRGAQELRLHIWSEKEICNQYANIYIYIYIFKRTFSWLFRDYFMLFINTLVPLLSTCGTPWFRPTRCRRPTRPGLSPGSSTDNFLKNHQLLNRVVFVYQCYSSVSIWAFTKFFFMAGEVGWQAVGTFTPQPYGAWAHQRRDILFGVKKIFFFIPSFISIHFFLTIS